MFDLKRQERLIVIFLTLTLIIGAAVAYFKKSRPVARVDIETFRLDDAESYSGDDSMSGLNTTININSSGVEALMRLKGVGQALAKRIVDYRTNKGPFHSKDELMNVKGVGQKLFDKMKNNISIE